MTEALSDLRRRQIGEALGDVEQVFFEPGCFGDCSLADAAASLTSEFDRGRLAEEQVPSRLALMVEADSAGNAKAARRHLTFVRRKLESYGIVVLKPEPLVPDAEAARNATNAQVAATRGRPGSTQKLFEGDESG
jgi:hypothetical protein